MGAVLWQGARADGRNGRHQTWPADSEGDEGPKQERLGGSPDAPGATAMAGPIGKQPQKLGLQSHDPGPRADRTRALLSLCQQKESSTDEPKAEGGPSKKKSQSLARFPCVSQSVGAEPID